VDDAREAEPAVQQVAPPVPVPQVETDRAVGARIIALRVLCEVEHWGVERPPTVADVPFLMHALHNRQRRLLGSAWGLDGGDPLTGKELARTISDKTTEREAVAMVNAAVDRLRLLHRANTGQAPVPIPAAAGVVEETAPKPKKRGEACGSTGIARFEADTP